MTRIRRLYRSFCMCASPMMVGQAATPSRRKRRCTPPPTRVDPPQSTKTAEAPMKTFLSAIWCCRAPALAQQSAPEIAFDRSQTILSSRRASLSARCRACVIPRATSVFTRSNSAGGPACAGGCAPSPDQNANVGEIGKGNYAGPSPRPCASTRTTTSGPSTKVPHDRHSTRTAASSGSSAAARNRPTSMPRHGTTPIRRSRIRTDFSGNRPT